MLDIVSRDPKYFMVPYSRNRYFTGRKAQLATLREKLCEEKALQYNHRVALFGLGGVGKTQLAVQYVYKHSNQYNAVFWVSAADESTLLAGFQEIANLLTGCSPNSQSDVQMVEIARSVLCWFQEHTNWLLVLDNLDDITACRGSSRSDVRNGH
jgi:NB-ARC domain